MTIRRDYKLQPGDLMVQTLDGALYLHGGISCMYKDDVIMIIELSNHRYESVKFLFRESVIMVSPSFIERNFVLLEDGAELDTSVLYDYI